MIILNGNKFALNDNEFTNSLFESGTTCVGYYRPLKAQIKLFDHNKNLIGAITKHKVIVKANKLENGKNWFNLGTVKQVGRYGSYMEKMQDITRVLYNHNIL